MADSAEVKEAVDNVRNRRRDGMFCAAFLALMVCVWMTVYQTLTEYSQGVLTMVIGNLISAIMLMYNFEYGTTRSSATKDATIAELSKSTEPKP